MAAYVLLNDILDDMNVALCPSQYPEETVISSKKTKKPGKVGRFEIRNKINMEIKEDDNSYQVIAELPGIPKDNIKIFTEGDILTIQGEKKREDKKESDHYHVFERTYGLFQRSIRMPENCQLEDNVKTDFKDGVLSLTFSKKEQISRKTIQL